MKLLQFEVQVFKYKWQTRDNYNNIHTTVSHTNKHSNILTTLPLYEAVLKLNISKNKISHPLLFKSMT